MQIEIDSVTQREELIEMATKSLQKRNFTSAEQAADRLFELKQLQDAIKIYQEIIENNPEHDYHIEGLGNNEEQIGYYEWNSYAWYKQERSNKRIKGSPYDGLSLCCMSHSKFQAGIAWYKDMTNKYPKNYQIRFGYANILYNNGIYEEAIYNYEEVAKAKPTFVKPLVDLGLLYQYRRIQKRKSTQKARQILALNNNNQYALFILARNENDIDKKIKLLEQAWKINLNYTRVCNQIGICYGGTKKLYEEAIKWYQRCTEINPKYSSCYNNIGVNNQLLKRFEQAEKWYFKAVEADSQYKTAYKNLTDVFDELKFQDDRIIEQSKQYNVKNDIFCYYIGLSYYDKDKTQKSITWIQRSISLNPNQHRFYNSVAISYDEIKDYDKAIQNYKKCIEIQPSYYSAYYNLAIVYKSQNKEEQAIKWYIKATQINPRYSYAYNNLGNIFKNQENYIQAIKYYEKAIEFNSTYTLAYINLGVCHLNLQQYREAFHAFESAQQIVNTDNNNLSESNKQFIKPHLQKFEGERYKWQKFGIVTEQNKELLIEITKEFQESFDVKEAYPLIQDKYLRLKEFIQILRVISQNNFEIANFREIIEKAKCFYTLDKNTFNIITDYLFQYFWKKKFVDQFSYEDIESQIQNAVSVQIEHELAGLPIVKQLIDNAQIIKESLQKYEKKETQDNRLNLFPQTSYFTTYKKLCNEIMIVNAKARQNLTSFEKFVTSISSTVESKVFTRISPDKAHQFPSILNVIEEIFKYELGDGVKSQITAKINDSFNLFDANLRNVAYQIYNTWNDQLTQIFLKERIQKNIQTACFITNFVEGVCVFATVKDLLAAVSSLNHECQSFGYKIVSFENRLLKKGQNSINITLKNKDFTFSLKLELQSTSKSNRFLRDLRKIENCAFGSIFECLLSVSKGKRYTLNVITEHIVKNMPNDESEEAKHLLKYAKDIFQKLPTRQKHE